MEAQGAFDALKQALMFAPVLSLPNFNQIFVVETETSNEGISAVLTQNGHPIAYISKVLTVKH